MHTYGSRANFFCNFGDDVHNIRLHGHHSLARWTTYCAHNKGAPSNKTLEIKNGRAMGEPCSMQFCPSLCGHDDVVG